MQHSTALFVGALLLSISAVVVTACQPTEERSAVQAYGKSSGNRSNARVPVDEWQPTAVTPSGVMGGIPFGRAELFEFLSSGQYRIFPAKENGIHSGRGPHTQVTAPVRVFCNDVLSRSLEGGDAEHPAGAGAVKEMFSKDGVLQGWAAVTKTQDLIDEGRGWFWYEVTSASDAGELAAIGNGVAGCIYCHSFYDQDRILSGHPPT